MNLIWSGIVLSLIQIASIQADQVSLEDQVKLLTERVEKLEQIKLKEDCNCDLSGIDVNADNIKTNGEDIIETKIKVDLIDESLDGKFKEIEEAMQEVKDDVTKFVSDFGSAVNKTIDKLSAKVDENTEAINGLESLGSLPIGSIIPWVGNGSEFIDNDVNINTIPDGWMKCDGSEIKEPSKWAGLKTPDLNSDGYFLRGAEGKDVMKFQEDALQDHSHDLYDPGHTHYDSGHNHGIEWCNEGSGGTTFEFWDHDCTYECGTYKTKSGKAHISTDETDVRVEKTANARAASETRPKNMAVEWIIKVY